MRANYSNKDWAPHMGKKFEPGWALEAQAAKAARDAEQIFAERKRKASRSKLAGLVSLAAKQRRQRVELELLKLEIELLEMED